MNNPTAILGRTVSTAKRCACVLALVLVLSAAGGVPSREARAQESPLSAPDVEATPTETIAPTTVSPESNDDKATVSIKARFKVH
jgi:hypothetical protein